MNVNVSEFAGTPKKAIPNPVRNVGIISTIPRRTQNVVGGFVCGFTYHRNRFVTRNAPIAVGLVHCAKHVTPNAKSTGHHLDIGFIGARWWHRCGRHEVYINILRDFSLAEWLVESEALGLHLLRVCETYILSYLGQIRLISEAIPS